jgi:RNA polymerase sigma factor (sigma-70 family)
LINNKTSRYKKFSNYQDLQQDGFEALIHAFETYDPRKGDFTWWASKYIGTRVSRSANCHSTIKIPLKKAKELPPFKDSKIPNVIDEKNIPDLGVENAQMSSILMDAINELPEQHKRALLLHYDFSGNNECSISSVSRALMVSRPMCIKILTEATEKLKEKLQGRI